MSNIYQMLEHDINRSDVCDEYKITMIECVQLNLKTINKVYETNNIITIPMYRATLDSIRKDVFDTRKLLSDRDKWAFDYVGFERHIIHELKQTMWFRMSYDDMKKVRS